MKVNVDLLTVGNAKMDSFVILDNLEGFTYDKFSNEISFPLGNKIPLNEFQFCLGGNASNVAVGASRLGLKSSLASLIGSDEFSEKILKILKDERVDISQLARVSDRNPDFNIILSYQGERTVLEEKNNLEGEIELKNISPKMIYLTSVSGNWNSLYQKVFTNYPDSEYIYNPGSRQIESDIEHIFQFLPKIKYLFVNLQEAQKIAQDDSPDIKVILRRLKTWGVENVIITDGINGSYSISSSNETFHISSATNEVPIEKTGAGDSYASGFIYAILKGHSIKDAMRYGALNADSVIKKIGAQTGLLTHDEIENASRNNLTLNSVKI